MAAAAAGLAAAADRAQQRLLHRLLRCLLRLLRGRRAARHQSQALHHALVSSGPGCPSLICGDAPDCACSKCLQRLAPRLAQRLVPHPVAQDGNDKQQGDAGTFEAFLARRWLPGQVSSLWVVVKI